MGQQSHILKILRAAPPDHGAALRRDPFSRVCPPVTNLVCRQAIGIRIGHGRDRVCADPLR